jgi:hypothetical protein
VRLSRRAAKGVRGMRPDGQGALCQIAILSTRAHPTGSARHSREFQHPARFRWSDVRTPRKRYSQELRRLHRVGGWVHKSRPFCKGGQRGAVLGE